MLVFLVIAVCFAGVSGFGYIYPEPPVVFDEQPPSSTPGGIYGPPIINFPPLQDAPPLEYLPPPGSDLLPPADDTVVIPPAPDHYLPPPTLYTLPKTQLTILNMSCLDTTTSKYFHADFRTSQATPPVVEDVTTGDCIVGLGDRFRMELEGSKLSQCGVKYCQGRDRLNLCVTLRMATVQGLKLPEDTVVTLQCRPQDNVVVHTKQFRLSSLNVQGRSAASVASGGSQRSFESQVGLFRKSPTSGEFTQAVLPGSAVQLGEELMLRAAVREGDGWKYSRMTGVVMHRLAPIKTTAKVSRDSVTMVDNFGCRSPTMKSVCPENPRQIGPLVSVLPFRAFMFQGAKSGEEMVLTVRVLGCLQPEDCAQGKTCDDKSQVRSRSKRDTHATYNVTDWQSYVEFKVVTRRGAQEDTEETSKNTALVSPYILTALFVLVLSLVGLVFAVTKIKK